MKLSRGLGGAVSACLATVIIIINFLISPRDPILTVGISSFSPTEIISNRLWTESPVQVLNTFMAQGTEIVAVGIPRKGGLPFAERLKLSFGSQSVDESQGPIDLRERLSEQNREFLEEFVQKLSYRSSMECPHDLTKKCTIAVGWNRERTKEQNLRLFTVRLSDEVYLIADDSIISLGG